MCCSGVNVKYENGQAAGSMWSMKKHKGGRDSKRQRPRQSGFVREVAVLYEDDALVVVNKPAGLLAVPVKGSDVPSALTVVAEELRAKGQRAFVVHRIDRFASGILVFAKTQFDRTALVRQFLGHLPVRQYLAVVRGHLPAKEGTLVHYFRRAGMYQRRASEREPKAARAELHYSVQKRLRGTSLVRVTLRTGLQNQIRVQFEVIGHPVVGDRKYAPEEAGERRIQRVALHAARLEFTHPRSGKKVSIDCRPPGDFESLVGALGG
jgi:23S rRNA pseudouridine1911/1915/1917 synthase